MSANHIDSNQPLLRLAPLFQAELFSDLSRVTIPRGHENKVSLEKREALRHLIDSKQFNAEQRQMVEHIGGPFLALAGAGSGKTHAATHYAARLVAYGVCPSRILAVTFTKKAAEEMKDRTRKLLRGITAGLPTTATLHSIGLEIIQEDCTALNYKNGIRIIPEIYADQFLQRGLDSLNRDERDSIKGDPIEKIKETISAWKNSGLDPASVLKLKTPLAKAYLTYQSWLQQTGHVDFDDLIRLPISLFTKTPNGQEILKKCQSKFDYIIVDEYQDTNGVQEDLLVLLAQSHRNICVVGDDDQSIYGWRGARVENIRNFAARWKGSQVVKLELNYRSTGNILKVANNLIANSKEMRHDKQLRAVHADGEVPIIRVFSDEIHEANWIAESIRDSGRNPGDFAILVRDQYKSKASRFEEALARLKIPYEVWFSDDLKMGPLKRNAYSILSAIHDPKNADPAFLQLLRSSRFELNTNDYERLLKLHEKSTGSIWELINTNPLNELSSTGKELIKELQKLIKQLNSRARKRGREEQLSAIAYDAFCDLFPIATAEDNWNHPDAANPNTEVLKKIVRNVASYEESANARNKNLSSYLQFQLVEIPRRIREGQTKKKANEDRTKVVIMTMHGSKGLEFPVVYLPAFIDGVIPHKKALETENSNDGISDHNAEEEELRLAYVAITRAKEELHISFPQHMHYRNRLQLQKPSRYIEYLKLDLKLMEEESSRPVG
jgi:DNA helicase II / ATP-dependent DNA helicase PcrA